MHANCITAYFCETTHKKIYYYLLTYLYGKKKPRKPIYSILSQQRIWPRPGYSKVFFHLFRSWLTKQREGSPPTKKRRTANWPFYPNPVFITISSLSGLIANSVLVNIPGVMDGKIHFQTKQQRRKYHCGRRVYNLSGTPWGRKRRNQNSEDGDQKKKNSSYFSPQTVMEALSDWLKQTYIFYQMNPFCLFPFLPLFSPLCNSCLHPFPITGHQCPQAAEAQSHFRWVIRLDWRRQLCALLPGLFHLRGKKKVTSRIYWALLLLLLFGKISTSIIIQWQPHAPTKNLTLATEVGENVTWVKKIMGRRFKQDKLVNTLDFKELNLHELLKYIFSRFPQLLSPN